MRAERRALCASKDTVGGTSVGASFDSGTHWDGNNQSRPSSWAWRSWGPCQTTVASMGSTAATQRSQGHSTGSGRASSFAACTGARSDSPSPATSPSTGTGPRTGACREQWVSCSSKGVGYRLHPGFEQCWRAWKQQVFAATSAIRGLHKRTGMTNVRS